MAGGGAVVEAAGGRAVAAQGQEVSARERRRARGRGGERGEDEGARGARRSRRACQRRRLAGIWQPDGVASFLGPPVFVVCADAK